MEFIKEPFIDVVVSNKYTYLLRAENYKKIINDFAKIPVVKTFRPKVGIVGEIFVK